MRLNSALEVLIPMDGVVNIDKPPRMTSHDVVQKVRTILREKRIGHTGTLDPLATGVLVLCVGKATRIAQYLEAGIKEYEAVMHLGVTTDTLDAEGRVLEKRGYVPPGNEKVLEIVHRFIGQIMQRPPAYSAIKVAGVPSYKLARQGKAEPLKERVVTIHNIKVTAYKDPLVELTVTCSKGVYIRTLCADIGEALGMGAHMTSLVRTRSGRFDIGHSIALKDLADLAASGKADKVLVPITEALADFPTALISDIESARILHGNQVPCPGSLANGANDFVKVLDPGGKLLSLARVVSGVLKPELVFS